MVQGRRLRLAPPRLEIFGATELKASGNNGLKRCHYLVEARLLFQIIYAEPIIKHLDKKLRNRAEAGFGF